MSDLPYFKFMVQDWLSGDVQICSHATKGIFADLLAKLWQKGGYLPNNDDRLAKLVGVDKPAFSQARAELDDAEILHINSDGQVYVSFVIEQLEELRERHEKLAKAGRKGVKAKQLKKSGEAKATLKRGSSIKESDPESETDQKRESSSRPGWNELAECPELRGVTLEQYLTILKAHPGVDPVAAVVRATIDSSLMAETINNPAVYLKSKFNAIELGHQPRKGKAPNPVAERIGLEKTLVRLAEEKASHLNFMRYDEAKAVDQRIMATKSKLKELE